MVNDELINGGQETADAKVVTTPKELGVDPVSMDDLKKLPKPIKLYKHKITFASFTERKYAGVKYEDGDSVHGSATPAYGNKLVIFVSSDPTKYTKVGDIDENKIVYGYENAYVSIGTNTDKLKAIKHYSAGPNQYKQFFGDCSNVTYAGTSLSQYAVDVEITDEVTEL